jgi:hypothetical protein
MATGQLSMPRGAAPRRDGISIKGGAEARVPETASFGTYELDVRSAAVLAMLLRLRAQEATFKIRWSRQGSRVQPTGSEGHEFEVRYGVHLWTTHERPAFRGLTFEVTRDRRIGARPAKPMMYHTASRAWCQAVGPRVDRGVRPRCGYRPMMASPEVRA